MHKAYLMFDMSIIYFTKIKKAWQGKLQSLWTQTGCCPFTFNGLECVLSSAQRCSEFWQYSELCSLPHCPLPQHHLSFQQSPCHYTRPAAIHTYSAVPFLKPLAAVVQTFQPGILAVGTEMWSLESLITLRYTEWYNMRTFCYSTHISTSSMEQVIYLQRNL